MTRQETGIIMDILTAAYPRFYSSTTGPDMRNAISTSSAGSKLQAPSAPVK